MARWCIIKKRRPGWLRGVRSKVKCHGGLDATLGKVIRRSYCRLLLLVKATPKSSRDKILVVFEHGISAKSMLQLLVDINTVRRIYIGLMWAVKKSYYRSLSPVKQLQKVARIND